MIPQYLIQSIGWTLVHSLWQGLVIYLIVKGICRFTSRADVRYGLGVIGLLLVVVCSIITFFALNEKTTTETFQFVINLQADASTGSQSFIQIVLQWIDSNIIWLLRFWVLGFVVGSLRIAAGLWYIGRLRRNAHPVQDEWMDVVKTLSENLNVKRVVTMAEAAISSPMVVGFMKPMVLFPVGLLAGLTADQVETILVHELSHVRRQDYIINLVQSVIETIFFFNPFVLLISSLLREERENCCDDIVIAKGISPIAYVRTLAQLEASRSSSSLVLGIAGNQNQLLNRIKRIMENSAKNDWGKGRLVPVALLFLGLICASWLSIGSETEAKNITHNVIASDTSKEDGLKVIKKGRYSWGMTPSVPAIEPVPEIEFIPDEEFFTGVPTEPLELDFDMAPMDLLNDFDMPEIAGVPMAPFEFDVPEVPMAPFEELEAWNGFKEFEFYGPDSIPGYSFRLRNPVDWEQFEKEFTEKFKSEFKDFYDKNQGQIKKMMEDARKDEAKRREAAEVVDMANMHRKMDYASSDLAALMSTQALTEQMKALESLRLAEMSRDRMQGNKEQMEVLSLQLRDQSLIMEDMARKSEAYMKALTEMLAEDGYIKKGDDLDGLHISDMNGVMTINGNKIKEKDQLKYRALRDSHFPANQKRMSRDSYRRSE